jgi:phosphoribosylanthranilate isomerase
VSPSNSDAGSIVGAMRMRIKMCGMMRARDVAEACRLGVDAVGVILHAEARRRITLDVAGEVLGVASPWVAKVGVFVNAPLDFVQHSAALLRLDVVQLHGDEDDLYIARLSPATVARVVRLRSPEDLSAASRPQPPNVRMLLLDSASGGSGEENDFSAIAETRARGQLNRAVPIALAGGLHPGNVEHAVRLVRPYAVDVSSGIEASFGEKDAELMRRFVEAVRRADAALA